MRTVLAFAAGLLLAIFLVGTLVHGQEQMFRGAEGIPHSHSAAWEGLWIAQEFARCCGERDCAKANTGDGLAVELLPDGVGYLVTIPQTNGQPPYVEVISYLSPLLLASRDGEYWVCHRLMNGDGSRQPRCVFVPPIGM